MFEYHKDDPIWDFNPAMFPATSLFLSRARMRIELLSYIAAQELASRQIHGYLITRGSPKWREQQRTVNYGDDYVRSHDVNPMYSEPEITNPWYISGIGEWDELYGDVSA